MAAQRGSINGARRRLQVGAWTVDGDSGLLTRGDTSVRVRPKVMDLLLALAERPGDLWSKAPLIARVWPDVVVSDVSLSVLVVELRKALGDDPKSPRFIETIPRRGYRLIAPVSGVEAMGTGSPSAGAACDYYFIANIPELKRDYRGVTLKYETRRLEWMTLLASYTYSSSKGSIGYSQNGNLEVDHYPWHFDNIYGYLSDHRRHRLKLNGFFNLKGDWTFAFDGRWSSPFTWTPIEDEYDNPEIPYGIRAVEPRGSREANSNYQLDLQVSKGFSIGAMRLQLIASVLNALGSERPIDVCMHMTGCGDIGMGEPDGWQIPRRYEAGFRLEF